MADNVGNTNELNKPKVLRVLFYIIITFFLMFNLVNVPVEFTRALIYTLMTIFGLIVLIIDVLDKSEIVDTITEEDQNSKFKLFRWPYKLLFGVFGILSIFIMLRIATTGLAIFDAPLFQAVPFADNSVYRALLSGIAGLQENLFFFGVLLPLITTNLSKNIKFPYFIAAIFGILSTAGIFSVYHFFVYGFANIVATQAVFVFGAMFATITIAFKSLVPADFVHFGNNFAIVLFQKLAISPAALFFF